MSRPLAALAASAALFGAGLTATADAAPATPKSVGQHIAKSQSAAKKVSRLVRKGDVTGAKKALRSARHEAVVASRGARSLAADAGDSPQAAQDAIFSLTAAAGALGESLTQFSNLIPGADSPKLQALLAQVLPGTAAGHAALVEQLTALVNELSGSAQTLAAQALAALQAAAPEQVQQVAEVAGTEDLPTQISAIIQKALSTATAALNTGISELSGLLPVLPAGPEAQITTALGSITSAIQALMPTLSELTTSVVTLATKSVQQATGMIGQLLNGVLGGFTGGDVPAAGGESGTGTSSSSGGLLSSLISIPMNLPKGIMGGLSSLLGGGLFGGLLGK